ncbi:MAG: DNA topoisomerase [Lachnospiraceae bacterium]|nr:DNA topoisomerase [Lachnospiraceae bacterium]
MGHKLLITEKPSVARDIARVIGADKRNDGYYSGNGYLVTWAVGHLIELAPPEAYGYLSMADMWDRNRPEMQAKAKAELPLFPDEFVTVVKAETAPQFAIIKQLFGRPDVDLVIDCGDMGSEGHYLQWLIRKQAGLSKPVKRFCATSMTDEAILAAMGKLRGIEEFDGVILGEWLKHRADWIFGLSLSRAASLKYRARVDVGRVLSPTLYFVVKRYMEAEAFKSTDYYALTANFAEGFSAHYAKDDDGAVLPGHKDGEGRILDKGAANALRAKLLSGGTALVAGIETKRKTEDRPQLYDITELMREANRIHGYGAEETLKTAQSLYEKHKILSYPRTDSRFITSDLAPRMAGYVNIIKSIPRYSAVADALLSAGLNLDGRVVDDEKVTDHHALVITEKLGGFDLAALSGKESDVLNLVITRMLAALSAKHVYDETQLSIAVSGATFRASGKTAIDVGFKAVLKALSGKAKDTEDGGKMPLPELSKGQAISMSSLDIVPRKTSAPKLHTEGTLLTAMENAGATVEGGAILKGRGIGTQATRAAIIQGLFSKNYIAEKTIGKTKYLVPTKQGINTIKVLPPDCYSPKITADWEQNIALISSGGMAEDEFMLKFRSFINEKLKQVGEMKVNVDFKFDTITVGKCPWCGASVLEKKYEKAGEKGVFYPCEAENCKFSLNASNIVYFSRTGKPLSSGQVGLLLETGSITASCKKKDTGSAYKCKFTLAKLESDDGSGFFATLSAVLPKAKRKKGRRGS